MVFEDKESLGLNSTKRELAILRSGVEVLLSKLDALNGRVLAMERDRAAVRAYLDLSEMDAATKPNGIIGRPRKFRLGDRVTVSNHPKLHKHHGHKGTVVGYPLAGTVTYAVACNCKTQRQWPSSLLNLA